jgi:hypothetical protein
MNTSRPRVLVTAALISGAVFAIDAMTPQGIAVGILYPLAILVSLWSKDRRDSLILAAGCVVLTVVGYFVSSHDLSRWALFNRALSVFAICGTGILAYRRKQTEHALHESISTLEDVLLRLLKAKRPTRMEDRSRPRQKTRRWVRVWRR